ncbi:hypothetical protein [Ammoniphilus sp. YIM 78166]|uniref:hypothetical protein n=1 Tax=Ammoniphilus sp. YIM 78166 TaxID=1644106 RepID=UPI00106F6FC8|nr:hypothetical protein [Ammoniphilus sp. YIM 78166]
MLSAMIQYNPSRDIDQALTEHGFKRAQGYYVLETKDQKQLARLEPQATPGEASIAFPGSLNMSEYTAIHLALKGVLGELEGTIEDTNSLLGYLPTGEGAYIITNFSAWELFLLRAKHQSMKGQKVKVLDPEGRVISEGLLMDYTESSTNGFGITECTLITAAGEQTLSRPSLVIEPTGAW